MGDAVYDEDGHLRPGLWRTDCPVVPCPDGWWCAYPPSARAGADLAVAEHLREKHVETYTLAEPS